MSLFVTSLASGSSGNAFLVQAGSQTLLVEAGLSARAIERYLRQRQVDPATLSAIIVSHEHHDHAQGAGPLARRYGVPVVCSTGTAAAMSAEWKGIALLPLMEAGVTVGAVDVWGFPLPHDAADPQGVLLEYGGRTVGWALDLGHVPQHLAACMAEADLVVIEANHDRQRLVGAPYPWSTKHRIMSALGHLSNLEAAQLLQDLGIDGRARTAWLAHLSERANEHPQQVLRIVQNMLDMAGVTNITLAIAERDRPSVTWPSQQPALFEDL